MDNLKPGIENNIKNVLTSNKSAEKKMSKLFWRFNRDTIRTGSYKHVHDMALM